MNKYSLDLKREMQPIPHAKYIKIFDYSSSQSFRMSMTVKISQRPALVVDDSSEEFDFSVINPDVTFMEFLSEQEQTGL